MQRREWSIRAENELRCEVADDPLIVKLLSGNAEIFGIEMALGKEYGFVDENFAIFTWYGCVIETIGNCETIYNSDSTPMISYVNTHIQLEARRDAALANQSDGPRVLIVGPDNHGKSTTARILAAYAARLDRTPMFVDLDVSQNLVTLPCCVVAAPIDKTTISIDDGFTNANPLVYFNAHYAPKENIEMYKHLVSQLALKIRARFDYDVDARASGIIVNTGGWIDAPGLELILHCVSALKIDVILVMSHDRLFSSLQASVGDSGVSVVKLAHSGGVVQRDADTRRKHRKNRIRQYFYGRYKFPTLPPRLANATSVSTSITLTNLLPTFSPSRLTLKLSQFRFYRCGGFQLSEGMRLIGASTTTTAQNTVLMKINPTMDLTNSVVAILHALEDEDPSSNNNIGNSNSNSSNNNNGGAHDKSMVSIPMSNVSGFLTVVQVDLDNDSLIVLSPCPGSLPSKHLLVGSLKWVE